MGSQIMSHHLLVGEMELKVRHRSEYVKGRLVVPNLDSLHSNMVLLKLTLTFIII